VSGPKGRVTDRLVQALSSPLLVGVRDMCRAPRRCTMPPRTHAPAPLAQSAEHIHGKDGVAGSIPAGGSTTNQQHRPGPTPGLCHARSAPNRRLPAICQQVTVRGRANTLRGDRLERLAVWSATQAARCRHQFAASLRHRQELTHPGALLSSDHYGSSVERTAKRHPLWRVGSLGRLLRMRIGSRKMAPGRVGASGG
jgi:hypothetical protein